MPDPSGKSSIPPYANQHALYFGVSNRCDDPSHPYGVHRHGFARYIRWAPEESQRYEADFLAIPGMRERMKVPRG